MAYMFETQLVPCYDIDMLTLVLNIIVLLASSEAARILAVYPIPSISHQVVFRSITLELIRRGHEVTVITTDPMFAKGGMPPNLTEIDVHDVSYSVWREETKDLSKVKSDMLSQITVLLNLVNTIFFRQLDNKEVQNLLKTKQFDLLLVEAAVKPALIFSHFYKVPVIQVSSLGAAMDNYDSFGAPTHPILYPSVIRRRINNLSAWEKISEAYEHYMIDYIIAKLDANTNYLLKSYFGDNIPSVQDLLNNIDMLFLNIHPMFEGIRPVPPNIVYMGGIHQKPQKDLPADLKMYLDSSKNGVIYVSFGTNVVPSLLPPESIQTIIKVLSELPYDVLWKYDKDDLPGKSDNIRIGKWFPQADLLRHPKIKAFITQGGLQSTDEAITAGVPLVAFPILGDQWFNAEKYEYHKIGVKLDIGTVNYDDLKNALITVTEGGNYRRNIVRLRDLINDEPMKPLERAMWWIEYVLRHGGAKHLRSPGANISWAQYLELELLLSLLVGILVCIAMIVTITYYGCKRILKKILQVVSRDKKKN